MLQSIYADRLSDEVLSVSASPDVRTEVSDVKSNLDTGESSAVENPVTLVFVQRIPFRKFVRTRIKHSTLVHSTR
jgi:hypothetical protein